ncbi:uncharacterized protein LOC111127903 [Crassostrea virginica]
MIEFFFVNFTHAFTLFGRYLVLIACFSARGYTDDNRMAYGFLTGFFLSLSIPSVVNGLTCYSCSYYENEIKRDYECVVSPANVTTANTVQCPDDSYCFTQIQYHKDSVVVRSITRGCGTQPSLDCGRNCCSTDIHWRTCLSECLANNEFCNDKDKSVTVIAKGPSGGAASITNLFTWSLTVCTLVLLVLY